MRHVDSHLDKPMLLESNKYGEKIRNVIFIMYSYLGNKCIGKYMCDCWITGSFGSLDEERENDAPLDSL